MRWSVAVSCGWLCACGPDADDGDAASSSGGASTHDTTTDVPSSSETGTTIAETTGSGTDDGSSDTTTTSETCVPGTFVGLASAGFENANFHACDTDEDWHFAGGQCPLELWVTVEGELCGPGQYGHLGGYEYELRGEIVAGPCVTRCGDEPDPRDCGSYEALCPSYDCDPLLQDCPVGDRCTPYSSSDTPPWNGTQCVPIEGRSQPVGAACTRVMPWHDDCGVGAHCVVDDRGNGTCAPLCNPELQDPCGVDTCWPCPFVDDAFPLGVCGATEVAC